MKGVVIRSLPNGAEMVWAVPTGGFGHAADEQPLPYIRFKGCSITPRYGGDESFSDAGYASLPLPRFTLVGPWPLRQKLFNFFRKRINIYWRNLFASVCRKNGDFFFGEQLNYKLVKDGFYGKSPIVLHIRKFDVLKSQIRIIDVVEFRVQLELRGMVVANGFVENRFLKAIVEPSYKGRSREFSSSTGGIQMIDFYSEVTNVDKGYCFQFEQVYEVGDGPTKSI
ncbi:hypothetical protein [Teredinibacter turnerae]|uniref:hypothetical protein n=1 Tax=Teredinibacter turnerae TaxID=2426 RepID=UPI0030D37863